jgi:hypothetical protein
VYSYDTQMHLEWGKAARDNATAQQFLEHYVHAPDSQVGYLDAIGGATTLLQLTQAVRG